MLILLHCVFVVHYRAYGLRLIKAYLPLETNPNFLISISLYPQTITKYWNTHRHKQLFAFSFNNKISHTFVLSNAASCQQVIHNQFILSSFYLLKHQNKHIVFLNRTLVLFLAFTHL